MSYSQKYTLVSFLKPVKDSTEFSMSDWPLHVTFADVFAIDIQNGIEELLAESLKEQPAITIKAEKEITLGSAPVVSLEKNSAINTLHTKIIDLLDSKEAVFNDPEFTREGFLPHSTIQNTDRLNIGDVEIISSISLVDMFPGGDWQQRKVLRTFELKKEATSPTTKSILEIETLHGHRLEDSYRWLESTESKDVSDWIDAQVAYTTSQHELNTQYDAWKSRVQEYIKIDRESLPVREGGKHFFTRQRADDDFPVLWVKDGDHGEERKLLDINEVRLTTADPTLEFWQPAFGGKLLTYSLSSGGAEIPSLYIVDVETGEAIEPVIPNASSTSWNDDATGFYYVRGPKPGTVPENDLRMNSKLYFHCLGTPYEDDPMIFGEGRPADDMLGVSRKYGAPFASLSVSREWSKNDVYLIDVASHDVKPFVVGEEAATDVVCTEKGMFIWTNQNANNAKLLFVDYSNADKGITDAKVLVPEKDIILCGFWLSQTRIFTIYTKDISDEIYIYDYEGVQQQQFPSPSLGTVSLRTSLRDDIVYAAIQTPVSPISIVKIDALSLEKTDVTKTASPHNPDDYVAYIEWSTAKDGTRLPMIIAHKKDVVRNGKNPTILYGYGGFSIAEDPEYIGANMAWLEAGGVFVDAVIRGGSEYGESWHKAGILENKQTSFDDFIVHAENLIKINITSSGQLGIYGGSNGGLLVGAVGVQRPELYKAVMSQVPLLDMVHFHTLLIASRWTNEYGNPDNKEDLERILKWSPYQNVKSDIRYPAFYFTTAENDTRVHPMHALKMTAKLQNVANPSTVLLWVERGAGHTSSVAKTKSINAVARRLSFFGWQLGLRVE